MTLEEITLDFSCAQPEFTSISGKPSDDDITEISKIFTPLLLEIPYNKDKDRERPQILWGIIADENNYTTVHGSKFVPPLAIKSYDPSITKDMVEAERRQKTTEWAAKKADRR